MVLVTRVRFVRFPPRSSPGHHLCEDVSGFKGRFLLFFSFGSVSLARFHRRKFSGFLYFIFYFPIDNSVTGNIEEIDRI
jgi:hypothetical protein